MRMIITVQRGSPSTVRLALERSQISTTSWRKWIKIFRWITLIPERTAIVYLISFLQIFVEQVRVGILKAGSAADHKRYIEGYLQYVVKISAGVDPGNPHLDNLGRINFCLGWKVCAYSCADPMPTQVRPIPIALLH